MKFSFVINVDENQFVVRNRNIVARPCMSKIRNDDRDSVIRTEVPSFIDELKCLLRPYSEIIQRSTDDFNFINEIEGTCTLTTAFSIHKNGWYCKINTFRHRCPNSGI